MYMGELITLVVKALGKECFEEACRAADLSIGAKKLKGRGHDPRERLFIGATHVAMIKSVVRHEKVFLRSGANSYNIFFAQGIGVAIYYELRQALLNHMGRLSSFDKRRLLEGSLGL